MKKNAWLIAVLALSAALGACGGDDDESAPTDAGGTGGDGGDSGSAPVAMPITCGSTMCQPPENPLGAIAGMIPGIGGALPMGYACCLAGDECGYAMSSGATGDACHEPAEADTRCPDIQLMAPGGGMGGAGGAMIPDIMAGFGCCVNNQCGVDGAAFGNGCTENGEARTMLSTAIPLIGPIIAMGIPEPRACDAPQPDAGDAGGDGDDAGN